MNQEDQNLAWEILKSEDLVNDEWMNFRRQKVRFPDGTEKEPFYNYSAPSYVIVVAEDTEGKYLCVRQFRHGIREVTTEFPAGGIECLDGRHYKRAGDPAPMEDTLHAARRELREETGYVSDEWEHVLTVPSNATRADNYAYIYYAKNCRRAGDLSLDESEFLNVHRLSADEIDSLIMAEKFQQAVHILAWLLVRRRKAGE